jgi:GH24 family phage-related lysozyme (muramidase)
MTDSDIFEMIAKLFQWSTAQQKPAPAPEIAVSALVPPKPATPAVSVAASDVPDDCLTFIENEEDGSPAYYVKHYEHFEWPAGASGPTIGVGYDCGYVTVKEAIEDWKGIVSDDTVNAICRAVGLRGDAAEIFVRAHGGSVTITWDQAVAEFKQREVPKWMARCRTALPNFNELPPQCQGALLSLTYNRGSGGYDDPGSRDSEMRAIKADMAEKKFNNIPMQILSMRRLWPRGGDLWNRRMHEATLFQKGLTPSGGVTTLQGSGQ